MLPETVARLAEIENIVAIKEATGSTNVATEIVNLCADKIELLSGDDLTYFPLLTVGAKGVISVTANVVP
jgi:4-hydroxy-tetrahydrodipicolinate synthase